MGACKKILIVEDSTIVRIEVKRALVQFDLELLELDNAEDLFRFPYRFVDVDLIILDITLPGLDGLSALEKIKQNNELKYIPVIMLTGRADRATVKKAFQIGAVNFLRKPFDVEELIERVEQVLGSLNSDNKESAVDLLKDNLEEQVYNEVKRAERGKDSVSFLKIKIPHEGLEADKFERLKYIQGKLMEVLREIDSVDITDKYNILVILPLTNTEGAMIVKEKIEVVLEQINKSVEASALTYLHDETDSEEFLKKLKTDFL